MTTAKPKKKSPFFLPSLQQLLLNYQPALSKEEATEFFSTAQIIEAIELHYRMPQADVEADSISGKEVVELLEEMGYQCIHRGELRLEWMLKKKI